MRRSSVNQKINALLEASVREQFDEQVRVQASSNTTHPVPPSVPEYTNPTLPPSPLLSPRLPWSPVPEPSVSSPAVASTA